MAQNSSPDEHIAAAKQRLTHLAGLDARTAAAETKIVEAAQAMHSSVSAQMDELRSRVHVDPEAADEYQRLTLERGRIDLIAAGGRLHTKAGAATKTSANE